MMEIKDFANAISEKSGVETIENHYKITVFNLAQWRLKDTSVSFKERFVLARFGYKLRLLSFMDCIYFVFNKEGK